MWNYYRNEPNSGTDADSITHSILNSESFDCKANFMENGETHNLTKNDVKIAAPLKYLSNFWRILNIPLINCEVELILIWFKNFVLINYQQEMLIMALILLFMKLIIETMRHFK